MHIHVISHVWRCRPLSRSEQPGAAAGSHQWQPETVRRLFDKELDNNHEEALLLAQLAAAELRAAAGSAGQVLRQQSTEWALRTSQVHARTSCADAPVLSASGMTRGQICPLGVISRHNVSLRFLNLVLLLRPGC